MEVKWSKLARRSLANVLHYVEQHFGEHKARSVYLDIRNYVGSLGYKPRIGILVEEWSGHGEIRRCLYGKNYIYYLLRADTIHVIIIWDSRQDPLRLDRLIDHFLAEMEE